MESYLKRQLITHLSLQAKAYVRASEGELPSLVAGGNIAGFSKVAAAMHDQGDWW